MTDAPRDERPQAALVKRRVLSWRWDEPEGGWFRHLLLPCDAETLRVFSEAGPNGISWLDHDPHSCNHLLVWTARTNSARKAGFTISTVVEWHTDTDHDFQGKNGRWAILSRTSWQEPQTSAAVPA